MSSLVFGISKLNLLDIQKLEYASEQVRKSLVICTWIKVFLPRGRGRLGSSMLTDLTVLSVLLKEVY